MAVRLKCGGALAALLALTGAWGGCVEVDGGALEARWDLRDGRGARIGCPGARQAVGLDQMELRLTPVGGGDDPCAGDERCRFVCDQSADNILLGQTPFFVPDGEYAISSRGLKQDGTPLSPSDGVVAPSAVVRRVVSGEVTDLNVNLIIVSP